MQAEKSHEQSDRVDALLAFLRLICEELQSLAFDIANLGEILSGDGEPEVEKNPTYELQAFDLLSQRVLAQARLLHGVEHLHSRQTSDWKARADALIQAVPFHAQRQRLAAALEGHQFSAVDANVSGSGGLDLF
jgi:hypothetical protein